MTAYTAGIDKTVTGLYVWCGTIDPRLAYCRLGGSEATDKELQEARKYGPKLAGLQRRTWPTRAAAEVAAQALAKGGAP